MTGGFVAWAASLCAAGIASARAPLRPAKVRLVVAALLALATIGAATTAAFKTGTSAGVIPTGHHLSTPNRIHDAGSGGLALALWAAVVSALALSDRVLRACSATILVAGAASAIAFSNSLLDLPGIDQRALVSLACLWQYFLLAAIQRSRRATAQA
jgi:Protein of unknown function (DUF998)